MRIAQISTLAAPVRRDTAGAGSVEGLVWTLTDGLTAAGHEVTVFACAGSLVPGELVATLPGPYGTADAPDDWELCEWINLCAAVEQSARFDIMHSHAYCWGMPLEVLSRAPMIHTLHVWPYEDSARLWYRHRDARVIALTRAQWDAYPDLVPRAVVPHGVDQDEFAFRPVAGNHACYLGRFIPGKGPVEAIAAARAAGLPLVLAGPANDYYEQCIAEQVDGHDVQYIGAVQAADRAAFLGGAGVLLAPIQAPEPFSLVLVEAMMCGTPVVASAVGAAPEVVDHGITGFCAADPDELPGLLGAALQLDRAAVRARAEERFTAARMVSAHLDLYERVAEGRG